MRFPPIEPRATPSPGEITPVKPTRRSGLAQPAGPARGEAFEAQKRYMEERFGHSRPRERKPQN